MSAMHSRCLIAVATIVALCGCSNPITRSDASANDVAMAMDDSIADECSGSATFTPPSDGAQSQCTDDTRAWIDYGAAWMPGACRLIPNYAAASISLSDGRVVSVSGDPSLFSAPGSATVNAGVEAPCGTVRCRYLARCEATTTQAGGVGMPVEIAITQQCVLPNVDGPGPPYELTALRIRAQLTERVEEPNLTDDAGPVDVVDCSHD